MVVLSKIRNNNYYCLDNSGQGKPIKTLIIRLNWNLSYWYNCSPVKMLQVKHHYFAGYLLVDEFYIDQIN